MKKIIGIDFDGTCVVDSFPYVGDNIGAAKVLRELADKNLLILYTVRDGKYLQDAVDWFRYNHINLYSVNYNPEPVSSSPFQRPYFVGFGRQNSTTIPYGILINAYICIHN